MLPLDGARRRPRAEKSLQSATPTTRSTVQRRGEFERAWPACRRGPARGCAAVQPSRQQGAFARRYALGFAHPGHSYPRPGSGWLSRRRLPCGTRPQVRCRMGRRPIEQVGGHLHAGVVTAFREPHQGRRVRGRERLAGNLRWTPVRQRLRPQQPLRLDSRSLAASTADRTVGESGDSKECSGRCPSLQSPRVNPADLPAPPGPPIPGGRKS